MSRSNRRRQALPKEPVELLIDRLSHEGRGVASNEGKVAFVDGALPGEQVTAVYSSRRGRYDEFNLHEVLQPSPHRVQPPCEFASICGGCLLQHLSPEAQLAHKQQVLFDHLKHSGGIEDFVVLPAMNANSTGYRRKARLAVRYVHKKNDVLVGFREKSSSFIADMSSCEVLVNPVGKLIRPLRDLILGMDGLRDIPQIEVAVGESHCNEDDTLDNDLQVSLTLRHLAPLTAEDQQRLIEFAQQHSLSWFLQPGGPDTVHKIWPADTVHHLRYWLPDTTGDIEMWFEPGDFTQVNALINRRMIRQALQLLDLSPEDKVMDLFCGLGNFTLPMARRCASVTGVEGSAEMLERARANAARNDIDNVDYHVADLFTQFDAGSWAGRQYDKILLDPPRSGAQEIVSRMDALNPAVVVYVSCNPATLARDAGIMLSKGYVMTHAGVMDMFPHTGHVESMARFERRRRKG